MKKLRVTVDGKVYDVLVEMPDEQSGPAPAAAAPPPAPAAVAPVAVPVAVTPPATKAEAAPAVAGGGGVIGSPMAGKIVSIDVSVGDTVAEGARVVTLEAMKMNTYVFAPHAGRVTAVHVAAGEPVEEGARLLTLG